MSANEMPELGTPLSMTYRNYRGEIAERCILPDRVWFGSTDWHPEPGWLMTAFDTDKGAFRDFALADCQFADLCASGQQVMSGNPKMEKSALERLAELRREVTDEPLHVSGRYFNSHSCTDLTRCGYGGTGEFWNPADGKAISILWGLWRDGGFDALTPAPEAAQMKAALTGKQNPDTLNAGHGPAEVWITHQETAFGQHLSSASEKLWDDEYLRIAPPITTFASNERYVRGDLSGPAAPAPGIVEAEAVPVDDRSLQFRIGDIGNQVHNIACEHQDDEDLSERLADLRSRLWAIAQELAHPPQPSVSVAEVEHAFDEIRELNMSGRDENGHRWANSDLIDQTVTTGLIALRALKGGDE